jgi:hypothetical protein
MSVNVRKLVCSLCGTVFVLVGAPLEPGRPALCGDCLRLPPPPEETDAK